MATEPVIVDAVADFLLTLGITYAVQYKGEQVDKTQERPWVHDLWQCQFTRGAEHYGNCPARGYKPGGRGGLLCTCPRMRSFETSFKTGTGLRKTKRISSWMGGSGSIYVKTYEKLGLSYGELLSAPLAGITLGSLSTDMEAASMSFGNWCDDFGYDNDSLKDFAVYQQCEKIARDVRAFFGADWPKVTDFIQGFEPA